MTCVRTLITEPKINKYSVSVWLMISQFPPMKPPNLFSHIHYFDIIMQRLGAKQTIYYISDNHFGHKNVIRFDNRPFADTELMDEVLVHN